MYLPLVLRPGGIYGMGVSEHPIDALNADWWFSYGHCFPPCVSLNKLHGDVPQTWCEPYELIFNEPEMYDPADSSPIVTVAEAVVKSKQVRAQCPKSWLIAGNVSHLPKGTAWLLDYIAQGGEYDQVGFHCYSEMAQGCIDHIENMKVALKGVPFCLTEWNTTTYDLVEFEKYMRYVSTLKCSAAFVSFTSYLYPDLGTLYLQSIDGVITEKGKVFAGRKN